MPMLREVGEVERFPYLAALGADPDDVGRLDVVQGSFERGGFLVNAESGEAILIEPGASVPDGVWVAQDDIDTIEPGPGTRDERHGFGEGWGTQGAQLGGDRSFAEEDSGGTLRAPYLGVDAVSEPFQADTGTPYVLGRFRDDGTTDEANDALEANAEADAEVDTNVVNIEASS